MSAHSASHRGGWLSALVAHVSEYVFEEVEETIEPEPAELEPYPVIAVVSAAPRSGATSVARMLAAELAVRGDGAAIVATTSTPRRPAPPSRAAIRLATALTGVADAHPLGRLCVVATPTAVPAGEPNAAAPMGAGPVDRQSVVAAARYLAPVVLDLSPDGSAAGIAALADRIAVVGGASGEPALLDAVAAVIGGASLKVVNRAADPADWEHRVDVVLPESRLGARAAALGTRPLGALGSAISRLADALELPR
jgi:hypothetical protein